MTLLALLAMLYSLALAIILAPSPLTLGLMLLSKALLLSLILSFSSSSWFALILFLIYIGGLLIMFSYFIAICPTETFSSSRPLRTSLFSFFVLLLLSYIFMPSFLLPTLFPPNSTNIFQLLISKNLPLLFFIILLLFFILILVVKITARSYGPLRPFNT